MSANVEVNWDYGWLAGFCRAHRIDTPTRHEAEHAVTTQHGGDWHRYAASLADQPRPQPPPRRPWPRAR
jgi:hypothetical protein